MFAYFAPQTIKEALQVLHEHEGVVVCAGGTDLLVRMRAGKITPKGLLDISRLGLNYITQTQDAVHIGAMASLTDVNQSELLKKEPLALVASAAGRVGSWQTRNSATLIGNACTGMSCADAAVALLALDAQVRVASLRGERMIPLADFFTGPRRLAIEKDELILEIVLEQPAKGGVYRSKFEKVGKRKELFISVVNIAAAARTGDGGKIESIGVAMGTVAPMPIRLSGAEAVLAGNVLTEDLLDLAVKAALAEISPRDSMHGSREYRMAVAGTLFKRAVREVCATEKGV